MRYVVVHLDRDIDGLDYGLNPHAVGVVEDDWGQNLRSLLLCLATCKEYSQCTQ